MILIRTIGHYVNSDVIIVSQQKLSFVKKKTGLLFFNGTDTVAVGQKTGWVGAHDYCRYRPTSKENVGQLPVAGPGGPLAQSVSWGKDLGQVDVATQQPSFR